MSPIRIKQLLETQPFQPFTVHTGDGARVNVLSREFAWLMPGNRTMQVSVPLVPQATADDEYEVHSIDVFLITKVTSPLRRHRGNGKIGPR